MMGARWTWITYQLVTLLVVVLRYGEGFEYDYTNGDYLRDHDPNSWNGMDVRPFSQRQCVPIPSDLTLCANVGYQNMSIPNMLGHDTVQEVSSQAKPWVFLRNVGCHSNTELFLCSLYAPVCLERPIYPCQSLCESVKASCGPYLYKYGFKWPEILRCDKFPKDDGLCIKQLNVSNVTSKYLVEWPCVIYNVRWDILCPLQANDMLVISMSLYFLIFNLSYLLTSLFYVL